MDPKAQQPAREADARSFGLARPRVRLRTHARLEAVARSRAGTTAADARAGASAEANRSSGSDPSQRREEIIELTETQSTDAQRSK